MLQALRFLSYLTVSVADSAVIFSRDHMTCLKMTAESAVETVRYDKKL